MRFVAGIPVLAVVALKTRYEPEARLYVTMGASGARVHLSLYDATYPPLPAVVGVEVLPDVEGVVVEGVVVEGVVVEGVVFVGAVVGVATGAAAFCAATTLAR